MHYGCTLDRLLIEILFVDPKLVPVYILKADLPDGLYRIVMRPVDDSKVVLVLPGI